MTVLPAVPTDAGMDDYAYIRRLRELLGDIPKPADEQFSGVGGTTIRYQASLVPINDDDYAAVTVGGVNQQIVQSRTAIPGGTVYVDFDTGLLVFGTVPPAASNNIQFTKSKVRYRDTQLLYAMQAGIRAMYPRFSRTYVDTSISLATNVWDYALPLAFNDDQVRIASISVQEIPSTTEPFRPLRRWHRVGLNQLHISDSQAYTPGSVVRVTYYGPYQSLSGLDPRAANLPIWYAAGLLLGFREEKRARTDTQNVAAGEQANPNGSQQNAGAWYMRQFWTELGAIARPMQLGGVVSTYGK